jgi:uroporphyrinogen III methyltransferase/synthase
MTTGEHHDTEPQPEHAAPEDAAHGAQSTQGRRDTHAPPSFTAVLTRPAGQSAELAARLAREGIEAFEFPLIDIAPAEDDGPLVAAYASLEHYALVVFVSPNAVDRALVRTGNAWPREVPIGVVGPGSVAELARHGIADPIHQIICPSADASAASGEGGEVRFDSEALLAAIDASLGVGSLAGKRVLIVRGDGGREWLADRLREAGAQVEVVAAYRRVVPQPDERTWARVRALLAGAPHAWVLTSSEGVRNLEALAREHLSEENQAALERSPIVTPHPRIAETARTLGFDTITQSGPGDDRILAALRGLSASSRAFFDQPARASFSAHSRMTDTNHDSPNPAYTQPVTHAYATTPPAYDEPRQRRGGVLLWVVVVLLVCATGVAAFALNRKLERIDARLAARQQANDAQTTELRVKMDEALAAVHQIDTQSAQLQAKLADAQTAQQALQQQYQNLASNRDDWTFAEVEQMLSSASEQLQLTGNTQLALFALQSADTRLAASANPQALVARRAIAEDIDKLKATPSTDLTGLAIKLDDAINQIDTLPLAGEAPMSRAAPATASSESEPANASNAASSPASGASAPTMTHNFALHWQAWWHAFAVDVGQQLKGLVQVRRIDNAQADAMLNSPEQGEFLRENVKLRLLSARLALLSRNQTTLKSDLHAADATLARYFDASSQRTQMVRELVKEVDDGSAAVEIPNLNNSLQAVHNYKSGG